MKKILISTSYTFGERENTVRIDNAYTGAVLSNGGLALSLPIESRKEKIDAYLDMADGVILTGGIDVSPMLYDSYSKTEMDFHEERDDFEGALFEGALERGLPILGICRGLQLVNVLRGGSLYQDLELSGFKEVRHSKRQKILLLKKSTTM